LAEYKQLHAARWPTAAKMKADPMTQKWWKLTDPCHEPLADRKAGEWLSWMEERFHQD